MFIVILYKNGIMKNYLILLTFLFVGTIAFSQTLRNEKYEMYLVKFEENEVNIAKGMYMTDKNQSYYEGEVEVTLMANGETKNYNFFFSTWDDNYKEFLIKDDKHNIIGNRIAFIDKETAYLLSDVEKTPITLENTNKLESSILSAMVVWLDNLNKN